jgi:DNA-binding FadR family transcriptional regulator
MSVLQKSIRTKLVDQVIQQLQENILLAHYKPGEKLPPEPQLMAELGVGRSTLREAVKVLANAGLLEVRHGEGTFVSAHPAASSEPLDRKLKRASLLEVFEVKRMLEIEIAGRAAANRTDEDVRELESSLKQRKQAVKDNDIAAYIESDIKFHNAMAAATQNSILKDLYTTFSLVLRDALAEQIDNFENKGSQLGQHEKICKAIVKRDAGAAKQLTAEYLDLTIRQLRDRIH